MLASRLPSLLPQYTGGSYVPPDSSPFTFIKKADLLKTPKQQLNTGMRLVCEASFEQALLVLTGISGKRGGLPPAGYSRNYGGTVTRNSWEMQNVLAGLMKKNSSCRDFIVVLQ